MCQLTHNVYANWRKHKLHSGGLSRAVYLVPACFLVLAALIGYDWHRYIRKSRTRLPEQSVVATRIFESELSALNKGHVCPVVLCEVVWVLERAYGQKKAKLSEVIRTLLLAEFIEVEHRDAVWKALRDFESGKADFSDYLIARINQVCGSSVTLTFDRAAAASPGMFRLAV